MKVGGLSFLVMLIVFFSACQKNDVSKIPQIGLISFEPQDSLVVHIYDSVTITFNIVDGDGDIGNDTVSMIYLKDSRFDTAGYVVTPFPAIDAAIENPKKGITAVCTFYPFPPPIPRADSMHYLRDTLTYQLYITDRAGNKSNIITTPPLIVTP